MRICVWSSDRSLNMVVVPRMSLALITMACFLTGRWKGNTLMLPEDLDISRCKGALHYFQYGPKDCTKWACAAPFSLV